MNKFPDYIEWRAAITGPCGLTLSRSYCRERITALQNPEEKSTHAFNDAYGKEYLAQVLEWFKQAEREATQ